MRCGRLEANLENLDGLRRLVRDYCPDVIVNSAAFTAVDRAESEPELARRINATAVACIAQEAKRTGALLIHYSTDYVFDGKKPSPYVESDEVNPLNVYGLTKSEGEEAVRHSECAYFIFRTSWVYSSRGTNFIDTMLRLAASRDELSVVSDQVGAPTHADLIADASAHALHWYRNSTAETQQSLTGTYHMVAAGETSWNEYARFALSIADEKGIPLKVRPTAVKKIKTEEYPAPAKRPKNSRLSCGKLERTFKLKMPDWTFHVERYMQQRVSEWK